MKRNTSHECRSFDRAGLYVISVEGHLPFDASDFLNGMAITNQRYDDASLVAVLLGALSDQAALLGVLNSLYERGYPVLSVQRVQSAWSDGRR